MCIEQYGSTDLAVCTGGRLCWKLEGPLQNVVKGAVPLTSPAGRISNEFLAQLKAAAVKAWHEEQQNATSILLQRMQDLLTYALHIVLWQ